MVSPIHRPVRRLTTHQWLTGWDRSPTPTPHQTHLSFALALRHLQPSSLDPISGPPELSRSQITSLLLPPHTGLPRTTTTNTRTTGPRPGDAPGLALGNVHPLRYHPRKRSTRTHIPAEVAEAAEATEAPIHLITAEVAAEVVIGDTALTPAPLLSDGQAYSSWTCLCRTSPRSRRP